MFIGFADELETLGLPHRAWRPPECLACTLELFSDP
jgi:hypothetical protein